MSCKLIQGGKVYTVTQGVLDRADILIREGKIAAVGRDLPLEPGCEKIDASGLSVYPGMIDTHTHLGLDEWGNWDEINELNEMGDPITPQLRAVGMLVRKGLDETKALEAMTINGAKIIGCEDRIGSIEVGKDADLFLADGSPFDPMTTIRQVFIDGETIAREE